MDPYVSVSAIKTAAAGDDDSSGNDVWELLALGVSRLFDRETEVPDGFYLPPASLSVLTTMQYRAGGTEFIQLSPYIAGSIDSILVDSVQQFGVLKPEFPYREKDGYLIFDSEIKDGIAVAVEAVWGFAETPKDVVYACIEQALFQWRRKDLSFTDLSGVSSAAVAASFAPTFKATATRYRGLYGRNSFFG